MSDVGANRIGDKLYTFEGCNKVSYIRNTREELEECIRASYHDKAIAQDIDGILLDLIMSKDKKTRYEIYEVLICNKKRVPTTVGITYGMSLEEARQISDDVMEPRSQSLGKQSKKKPFINRLFLSRR